MVEKTPLSVEGPKLPSADLINFRFDQIDGSFAEIKQTLKDMTESSVPRAEIMLMKKDRDDKLSDMQTQIDNIVEDKRWLYRAIMSAVLLAAASVVLTLAVKR